MSDAAFGNPKAGTTPTEALEVARDLADPAQPAAGTPPTPAPAAPKPDAEPAAPTQRQDTSREAIAARFKGRRSAHDASHRPEHVPPFVDHAAEAAATPTPDAAQSTPAPVEATPPAPDAPAPASYTLKVRGKEQTVDRATLLKLADVEAHEEGDFDDARLIRYAQKNAAADANLELARQQRAAAAPAPADPAPAQAPAAPAPTDLGALARDYHEKMQYGTPDEATAAWQALETAKDQQRAAQQSGMTRDASLTNESTTAIESFKAANPDFVGKPIVHKAVVMQVAEEIEQDLRAAGLTDEHLAGATGNPVEMDRLYRLARHNNVPMRSQADLLAAAGHKVREGLGLPPVTSSAPATAAPPSSAAATRLDEKRGLPAQPQRSGNPAAVTPPRVDQTTSRKNAIAQMRQARTAPNSAHLAG